MGSTSSGKSKTKSTQKSEVWGAQSPFLVDLYRRGADLMQDFEPSQQVTNAWQNQLNPQMNPYLGQMTNQYTQALGQLDNQTGIAAAQDNMFGGARHGVEQHLNQQNIGNQVGNFLGGQYQADQARAMTALSMSPQMTPFGQQMGALGAYGSVIGNPTVLGEGSSSGRERKSSFGVSAK